MSNQQKLSRPPCSTSTDPLGVAGPPVEDLCPRMCSHQYVKDNKALALNVRTYCMLYVLALNVCTCCMLYVLALNVRTNCMLYVLLLKK